MKITIMKQFNIRRFAVAFFALVLIAGCSRDPNVRKQKYLESGNRYFEKQKYHEAIIQYTNALKYDPNYAQAHYRLGESYLRLQNWPGAYTELQRATALDPKIAQAQVDLGHLYVANRDLKSAKERLAAATEVEPNNADVLALKADIDSSEGNIPAAIADAQKAVELDASKPDYVVFLSKLHERNNQLPQAEQDLKGALAKDEKSELLLSNLAQFYARHGRWPESEAIYRKTIEASPKEIVPRQELATLLLAQQRNDDAVKVAEDARQAMPDKSEAYRMLPDLYLVIGQTDKAMAEFSKLATQHPKDDGLQQQYAALLLDSGKLDDAGKIIDHEMKSNGKAASVQLLNARLLMARGKAADAKTSLERLLRQEPDNAEAHHQLARADAAVGEREHVIAELRKAAELQPNSYPIQTDLAKASILSNNLQYATEATEKMIAIAPRDPNGYLLRAAVEMNPARNARANAEADLKKAMELAPNLPAPYLDLATLRLAENQLPEAEHLYQQALDHDANSMQALRGLVGVYAREKQPAKAKAVIADALAKSPDSAALHAIDAELLAAGRDVKGTEAELQNTLRLSKDKPQAYRMLTVYASQQHDLDLAYTTAKAWVQAFPNDIVGLQLLGSLASDSQHNWDEAKTCYEKVLALDPNNAAAANNLAYGLLEHGGNIDMALSYAQTARRLLNNNPDVADTLGWAYYQKGSYGLALDQFLSAQKMREAAKQPSALVEYHIGMTYLKMKQSAEARKHIERALQLDPKFANAEDARKALTEAS